MAPPTIIAEMRDRLGIVVVSDWVSLTQDTIDIFARATGDHQFIHVDPEKSRRTPFGGTIAHGMLLLSLLPGLAARCLAPVAGKRMGINYGFDRVRFLAPVKSGAMVRGRFALFEASERPAGILLGYDVTLDADHVEKPVLAARWFTLAVVDATDGAGRAVPRR